MIKVKLLDEWHTIDTLNGYYCLEDVWKAAGKPEDFRTQEFVKRNGPHRDYSIQRVGPRIWGCQSKVYQYCGWLCPEFKADMKSHATGVIHE